MAVNTTSGFIHWVVDGTLVVANQFEEVKNPEHRPRDLSKKLLLGARSYGGSWFATALKVTNVGIFSTTLSIEKMKSMTKGGSCVEEGDYLAWTGYFMGKQGKKPSKVRRYVMRSLWLTSITLPSLGWT